jgi:hypothetical protein
MACSCGYPLDDGLTREKLDPMLREVASKGPWVSAHPDVILKMGVKEVLYHTKHLGWGTDTHLYRTAAEFRGGFPARLASGGARVLKQNRGNGGQGIWKVERRAGVVGSDRFVLKHVAACRRRWRWHLMARCENYFAADGCIVDQPFQLRLPEG